jgi:hypothetical protein
MDPNQGKGNGGNGNGNGNGHAPLFRMGQDRVRRHTSPPVNQRIDALTRAHIEDVKHDRDAMLQRLRELDGEWDIDRAVMGHFALLGGASLILGIFNKSRGMLALFGAQCAFLLQHATLGWCPQVPLFRRLGFRTQQEICAERAELQTILAGRAKA